jgi:hypothetical protein
MVSAVWWPSVPPLRSPLRPALGITRLGYQSSAPIAAHPAAELVPIDAVVFPAAMTDAPTNDFERSQLGSLVARLLACLV